MYSKSFSVSDFSSICSFSMETLGKKGKKIHMVYLFNNHA